MIKGLDIITVTAGVAVAGTIDAFKTPTKEREPATWLVASESAPKRGYV
jgi:hypothetical protein